MSAALDSDAPAGPGVPAVHHDDPGTVTPPAALLALPGLPEPDGGLTTLPCGGCGQQYTAADAAAVITLGEWLDTPAAESYRFAQWRPDAFAWMLSTALSAGWRADAGLVWCCPACPVPGTGVVLYSGGDVIELLEAARARNGGSLDIYALSDEAATRVTAPHAAVLRRIHALIADRVALIRAILDRTPALRADGDLGAALGRMADMVMVERAADEERAARWAAERHEAGQGVPA